MTREQLYRSEMEKQQRRIAELRMLAESRATADSRYVADVIDFVWASVLRRKLANCEGLKPREYRRLNTLAELYAA